MTATAMTARIAPSKAPRRGAGRVRGVVAVTCVATIVLLDLASRCRVCGALAGEPSRRAIDAASTPALSPLYATPTTQVGAMGRLRRDPRLRGARDARSRRTCGSNSRCCGSIRKRRGVRLGRWNRTGTTPRSADSESGPIRAWIGPANGEFGTAYRIPGEMSDVSQPRTRSTSQETHETGSIRAPRTRRRAQAPRRSGEGRQRPTIRESGFTRRGNPFRPTHEAWEERRDEQRRDDGHADDDAVRR